MPDNENDTYAEDARHAYMMADAMLVARKRGCVMQHPTITIENGGLEDQRRPGLQPVDSAERDGRRRPGSRLGGCRDQALGEAHQADMLRRMRSRVEQMVECSRRRITRLRKTSRISSPSTANSLPVEVYTQPEFPDSGFWTR